MSETMTDSREERVALILWHRFAPGSSIEWEDEPHKAEYRLAAEAVIAALELSPDVSRESLDVDPAFAASPSSPVSRSRPDGLQSGVEERLARALAVPEHHTGYDMLSKSQKDLLLRQAGYALKQFEIETAHDREVLIETLDLLVRALDTNHPDAASATASASALRRQVRG